MSGSNAPSVQVFHFTSRISSAKIRKYKLATERGMAGGSGRESTPTSGIVQASPSPALGQPSLDSSSAMEPPSKKPKLKLNVRRPSQENESQSPDTIAVSRPRRDSSMKIRFSENMTVDDDFSDLLSRQHKPSPAASSDLSSLSSAPPPPTREQKAQPSTSEPAPGPSKSRDYSRDFMSYYVTGAEEEENEEEALPQPKPVPRKSDPPRQHPAIHQPQQPQQPQPPQQPPQETRFKHHMVPPPYPNASKAPTARAPPPLPQVNLIDTIKPAKGSRVPDTVASMVKKLEVLSRTLTEFGGVPSAPKSPSVEAQKKPAPQPEPKTKPKPQPEPAVGKKAAAVDNFLAMFDDDDSDEKDDQAADDDANSGLNYKLPENGESDGPLKYGIQFIQNALRSWAYQRVTAQVHQQYQQQQMQARADSQHQKRGPGRPRKFDSADDHPAFPPNPPTYQFDLANTPEGAAIVAFQEVLDSGCLRLNSVLPIELSRALRHLYKQIDQLINQGSRNEPQWRCMSYGAQITAHKVRVEKWKEQQTKAQEEMARQQHLAQQQVMQQMGLPTHAPRMPMTAEQAQQAHAIELERRRGMQHAAQQPHLTKYLTNPMSLESSAAAAAARASSQAASPVTGTSTKSPSAGPASASGTASTPVVPISPSDPKNVQLDKIKLYMPNFLPRSGQSMKFSFAPHNEAALKAFGPEAFPTAPPTVSNIPNRGPMNIVPSQSPTASTINASRPTANGTTPLVSSNPPTPQLNREDSDTIAVAARPSSRRESQSNGSKTGSTTQNGAVNSAGPRRPSSSMSASSVNAVSGLSASGVGKTNGKASDMASRFPHPGAVVVDR